MKISFRGLIFAQYKSINIIKYYYYYYEKIVHSAIHSHVAPFLTDWQKGFVKSRSCATYQLVLTHHQWTKAVEDGLQVDVVFLDFAKAFVKVLHVILLQKLCNLGISEFLLTWCEDYLTERELWVVRRIRVLPGPVVPSFIPQGSLLGSLFFVIFITIYLM